MSDSEWLKETDAVGREKWWEDAGRPGNDGLALKIFSETCCSECTCKSEHNTDNNTKLAE